MASNRRGNRRPKQIPSEELHKLRQVHRTEPNASFLAFDLEVDENNHDTLLEIGYVIFEDNEESFECHHYIIQEHRHIRNTCERNNSDGFRFGSSETLRLRTALERFVSHTRCARYLVTHAGNCDLKFLNRQGVYDLDGRTRFDTQMLDRAVFGNRNVRKLSDILESLDIQFQRQFMHNAGNDAVYTMKAFLRFLEYA